MELEYEDGFSEEVVAALTDNGHKMIKAKQANGYGALTAIGRSGNQLTAVFDPRRQGSIHIE